MSVIAYMIEKAKSTWGTLFFIATIFISGYTANEFISDKLHKGEISELKTQFNIDIARQIKQCNDETYSLREEIRELKSNNGRGKKSN